MFKIKLSMKNLFLQPSESKHVLKGRASRHLQMNIEITILHETLLI